MYNSVDEDEIDVDVPAANWTDDYSVIFDNVQSHHVLIFFIIVFCLIIFHYRNRIAQWHDRYRTRSRYSAVGFQLDIENGLTSSTFDLNSNVSSGDSRDGLLEAATAAIREIMEQENESFDQARLRYFQQELQDNGIGADGVPVDKKTVTFS